MLFGDLIQAPVLECLSHIFFKHISSFMISWWKLSSYYKCFLTCSPITEILTYHPQLFVFHFLFFLSYFSKRQIYTAKYLGQILKIPLRSLFLSHTTSKAWKNYASSHHYCLYQHPWLSIYYISLIMAIIFSKVSAPALSILFSASRLIL